MSIVSSSEPSPPAQKQVSKPRGTPLVMIPPPAPRSLPISAQTLGIILCATIGIVVVASLLIMTRSIEDTQILSAPAAPSAL